MMNQEKFNQLNAKFKFNSDHNKVYLSNRYFTTIEKLVKEKKIKKTHSTFVYAYMYLQNYMFRYAKYDDCVPSVNDIKEILGFSANTKELNYLIKKDGVLDSEGLTVTIFDFPVVQEWEDNQPTFTMLSEINNGDGYGSKWRKERGIKTNQSCKYPVYAFVGEDEDFDGEFTLNNLGGSFFEMPNTTMLEFNIFNYCMANDELGCTGFFLYSYIKWKCDVHGGTFGIGQDRLARDTGMSKTTIVKYLTALRQYNLLDCFLTTYVINATDTVEPNVYANNDFEDFIGVPKELKKAQYITQEKLDKQKEMGLKAQAKGKKEMELAGITQNADLYNLL